MNVSIIIAISENNVIGINNKIPWNIPSELKHFKDITDNKPVIMGRRTAESLKSYGVFPLKNRDNIILSRNLLPTSYKDAYITSNVRQALDIANVYSNLRKSNEIMVIGGKEVYTQLFPYTNTIYLTRVHCRIDGDSKFNLINMNNWNVSELKYNYKSEKDDYNYSTMKLTRKIK